VVREYYVNDAGAQVQTLARSAHLRYREALGEDIGEIPEGFYPATTSSGRPGARAEFGDRYAARPRANGSSCSARRPSRR
jgi:arginyl-tRNA synthetase